MHFHKFIPCSTRRGAYAIIPLPEPIPHLNLLNVPVLDLATSLPQVPESTSVEPFKLAIASCLPTSLPITNPAPNTNTTTPADIAQNKDVGDSSESSTLSTCTFFFFDARTFSVVGRAVFAFRLPFSAASCEDIDGLLRARVDGVSGRDVFGALGAINSDSGTNRSPIGSFDVIVGPCSRFGRPLAAAAPIESRVVRDARKAAS